MRAAAIVVFIILQIVSGAATGSRHQLGAVSSGRSLQNGKALVSIVGQPIGGAAGTLNSGFLPPQWRPPYLPGDANSDSNLSIADAVFLINYIFGGGPAPQNLSAADADCSGSISIADAVYLINYIFGGGPQPIHC